MSRTIIGHVSLDLDCLVALWQLQRFGPFADAAIVLVPAGESGPADADAVVDTGRAFDSANWRFDHHQFAGAASSATCAAAQVHQRLCEAQDGALLYLAPLIALITAGDGGKAEADQSREVGLHALLSARKAARWTDDQLIVWAYQELDFIASGLKTRQEARATLAQHVTYRSADGLVVALDRAPQGATFAAFEEGAAIVVWHNPMPETIAVGVNRARESGIDCGGLVGQAMEADALATYAQHLHADPFDIAPSPLYRELASFYHHPSGFFAGRGTAKAPDARPLAMPIADIARAIDAAWAR